MNKELRKTIDKILKKAVELELDIYFIYPLLQWHNFLVQDEVDLIVSRTTSTQKIWTTFNLLKSKHDEVFLTLQEICYIVQQFEFFNVIQTCLKDCNRDDLIYCIRDDLPTFQPKTDFFSNVLFQNNDLPLGYVFVKPIGRGSCGVVSHVSLGSEDFAIKEISYPESREAEIRFNKEVQILKDLSIRAKQNRISNILQYITSHVLQASCGRRLFIVTELVTGGDLTNLWKNPTTKENELKIILGCYEGLKFLQQNDDTKKMIFHRDIKPENILITNDYVPKLADFGLSDTKDQSMTEGRGTPRYLPPEVALFGSRYPVTESYSLAASIITLWSRKEYVPLWLKKENRINQLAVLNSQSICTDIEHWGPVPEKLKLILKSELHPDHNKRQGACVILENLQPITPSDLGTDLDAGNNDSTGMSNGSDLSALLC